MSGGGAGRSTFDARAVSSVIGVVLMVAIVTLLAGAVSYVVLGYGDEKRTPEPKFAPDNTYNRDTGAHGQYLNVTHQSGESISTDNLTMRIRGAVVREVGTDAEVDDAELTDPNLVSAQVGDEFEVSETFSISESSFERASGGAVDPGSTNGYYVDLGEVTVQVVWQPPDEDRSTLVYEWSGPDG